MDYHDMNDALLKLTVAWIGTMFGGITLSSLVLFATLIYTTLMIYVLIRDRIWPDTKRGDK